MLKILALGDVVGRRTIEYLRAKLWQKRSALGADFVVANGENVSEIHGITSEDAAALFDCGIDFITTGNHVWQKRDLRSFLDDNRNILRPANYRPELPGRGWGIYDFSGKRVLVMNLMGTVYLDPIACPFSTVDAILEKEKGNYDISVLDFHAEATSEKIAMAYYLDGRVSAVYGTHTHVQTSDARVFPKGTGFITDLGMTGPLESVLGVRSECIIEKLKYHIPVRFETAKGNIVIHGAKFTIDADSGKTVDVTAI